MQNVSYSYRIIKIHTIHSLNVYISMYSVSFWSDMLCPITSSLNYEKIQILNYFSCLFSYIYSAVAFMLDIVVASSLVYLENDTFTKLTGSLRTVNWLKSFHIKCSQPHVIHSELE